MITQRTSPRAAPRDEAAPRSDPDLMRQLTAGEIGALGELYDRYQDPIRRFLARATLAEDVDDLLHETFLAAAKCAERYDGRPCCRPWLIGIAARHLRRRRQGASRLRVILASLAWSRSASADPRPALQARTDIERALGRITEAKRITILMAEVEGLSCAEIAVALGVPIGTVWTRLHAARRELRQALEGGQA
jgi:RNA polymerase sigma factor (sigma-70 family)